MMLNVDRLKSTVSKLGYTWYSDRPNLIGVRTTLQVPDVFNDFLCMVWIQEKMPAGLSRKAQQMWLNKWKYVGKNGKPLSEDGLSGSNTTFALDSYHSTLGKERMKAYVITTEPGVYYQKNLLNPKGCAFIKPGQWKNAYSIGFHQHKQDHRALRQSGVITIYRDADRDGIAENLGVEETGNSFGCNIHGAKKFTKTGGIGPWSAGCQVFSDWYEKEEFIDLCELYRQKTANAFTYTLIEEKDLK